MPCGRCRLPSLPGVRSRLVPLLLVGVPLLWIAVANIGPLIEMARISLLDAYPAPPGHVARYSPGNYAAFVGSAGYREAFLRSFRFAAGTTILLLLLSYPLAYHLALHVPPARRGRLLLLLIAPFWTGEIVRLFGIILLLANHGAINIILRRLGLIETPLPLLYNGFSVGFGMVYTMSLSMLLPLYAALDRLPRSLLDAAADLGAGPARRLLRVTLPLSAGGVLAGCLLVFLLSLGVFVEPTLLGGASGELFAVTIGGMFSDAAGDWPLGAAFSFILLLTAAALSALALACVGHSASRPAAT